MCENSLIYTLLRTPKLQEKAQKSQERLQLVCCSQKTSWIKGYHFFTVPVLTRQPFALLTEHLPMSFSYNE